MDVLFLSPTEPGARSHGSPRGDVFAVRSCSINCCAHSTQYGTTGSAKRQDIPLWLPGLAAQCSSSHSALGLAYAYVNHSEHRKTTAEVTLKNYHQLPSSSANTPSLATFVCPQASPPLAQFLIFDSLHHSFDIQMRLTTHRQPGDVQHGDGQLFFSHI